MSSPPLTIRLFGPLQALVAGVPMPRVRTRSVEWLLTLLVLRPGRAVDRSWLAGTLWPESEENRARANLRDDLVRLRKALGSESVRLQSPSRDTLTLDLEGAEVDLIAFDAMIRAGDEASLRGAVALYAGPLLEGCYEAWAIQERDNREQACLLALETLAGYAEQRGDGPEALTLLLRAEGMDSLRDSIQRRLMHVLAASGDLPAALMTYREYRLRLRREMNAEPDAETTRLFQQLRATSKDPLSRTEPQKASPEALPPPEPPALAVEAFAPAPLPHPLTALIGREEAVREVVRQVIASRLVTLVGTGGVGKTRLCIQVAQEAVEDFPQGAAFVALASLSDPTLLPSFVASALGLREEGNADEATLSETLVGWLSGQSVLLALDNCEHLIEATAALAQTLLERCPRLHILATSRQRLGLTGEVVWRVPSLSSPDLKRLPSEARSAVARVLDYPAVQLFVERARMVRGGFRLTGREEAQAVARICERLDGIPLALEMAAARVRSLSVQEIQARLEGRFQLLNEGNRAALPRQKTLQAALDWSHDLLSEEERALLRRLSVFVGGWRLEAAEAIGCTEEETPANSDPAFPRSAEGRAEPETLDLLTSLVDKSLVVYAEQSGAGRYRLLETVQQYARGRLEEAGEAASARRRHLKYYAALSEEIEGRADGADQMLWIGRLDAEHDNLNAALEWGLADTPSFEMSIRITRACGWFWRVRGYLSEGLRWVETALMRTEEISPAARAELCMIAGRLNHIRGDIPAARRSLEEALQLCLLTGDTSTAIYCLFDLGFVALDRGDNAEATRLLQQALALGRSRSNDAAIGTALNRLGEAARATGDYPAARAYYAESLAMRRRMGAPRPIVSTALNLAEVLRLEGDPSGARALYRDCLPILLEIDDKLGIAHFLYQVAALCSSEQRLQQGVPLLSFVSAMLASGLGRLDPLEQRGYEALTAAARATLGEEAFEAAWAEGLALSLDAVIEYARKETLESAD